MIAVLFPRFDHPAIEERYASWQTQMLLRRGETVEFAIYDPEEPASVAAALVEGDHTLVVTDPLLIPPRNLASRLLEILVHTPEVVAAVPVANEAANPLQVRVPPRPYLTLRELEDVAAEIRAAAAGPETVQWDNADPAIYLCRTAFLDEIDDLPARALDGRARLRDPPHRSN